LATVEVRLGDASVVLHLREPEQMAVADANEWDEAV
jgi:hypothetical protein